MLYKIVEVSTDKASGHTYVFVHFWRKKAAFNAGKPPDRDRIFLMRLRSTEIRVVTNAQGWYKRKSDGKFIDPKTLDLFEPQPEWEREVFDRDLPAEIKANIEALWERAEAKNYPAHDVANIKRNNSDPYGVLARPDVAALENATVEKVG